MKEREEDVNEFFIQDQYLLKKKNQESWMINMSKSKQRIDISKVIIY